MTTTVRHSAALRSGVLGAMMLLAAGCGSSSSSSQPSPSATAKSPTPQPSAQARSFQVATPDGQVSVSLDGKLPPNWPSNFPTPPSATVAGSGSLGGSQSTGHVAVYSSPTPAPDVFSYYQSAPALTTTGAKAVGAGASYVGSTKIVSPYSGSVTVGSRSETTYVVVVLKLPAPSPSGQ